MDKTKISAEIAEMEAHLAELKALVDNPYTHAEPPAVGDYVRLTFADGSTEEGEVNYSRDVDGAEHSVRLKGSTVAYRWIPMTQKKYDRIVNNNWLGPKYAIVKVEHIERPYTPPAVGSTVTGADLNAARDHRYRYHASSVMLGPSVSDETFRVDTMTYRLNYIEKKED